MYNYEYKFQWVMKFIIKNVPCVKFLGYIIPLLVFFFYELSFLWCKMCTIMNTNHSNEWWNLYKKVPCGGGGTITPKKWRKCLECDEIWLNINNRIMRGRLGTITPPKAYIIFMYYTICVSTHEQLWAGCWDGQMEGGEV